MPQQQQKKAKGGRKLRRSSKSALKEHFARNFKRSEKNKEMRINRHEMMVADSQERHGGTTKSERSFDYRQKVRRDAFLDKGN